MHLVSNNLSDITLLTVLAGELVVTDGTPAASTSSPPPATSTATWLNHWWMPSSPSTTPGPNVPKSPGCTTGPASSAELDRWKHAAGREVRGLVLRRADERALCEGRAS
ncbi:MAG TPA: hypothetical protein ACQGQJ_03085 [Xylella fastidiosa subsp. multiplex]